MIKFARLFERGQRQILARLCAAPQEIVDEHDVVTLLKIETPLVGVETLEITLGYKTSALAEKALAALEEDTVFSTVMTTIDQLYEDEQ